MILIDTSAWWRVCKRVWRQRDPRPADRVEALLDSKIAMACMVRIDRVLELVALAMNGHLHDLRRLLARATRFADQVTGALRAMRPPYFGLPPGSERPFACRQSTVSLAPSPWGRRYARPSQRQADFDVPRDVIRRPENLGMKLSLARARAVSCALDRDRRLPMMIGKLLGHTRIETRRAMPIWRGIRSMPPRPGSPPASERTSWEMFAKTRLIAYDDVRPR